MKRKKCCKCSYSKPIDFFHKDSSRFDGYYHTCKECESKRNELRRKSKHGVVRTMYKGQLYTSLKRKHNPPEYTFEELKSWVYSQSNWNAIYSNWVKNNYNIYLKPSIDRLDDSKGYSFNNIRLITWGENLYKAIEDQKSAKMIIGHRSVCQLSLNGKLIEEFKSISIAGKTLGFDKSSIAKACKGKLKTVKGFKWFYKEDYEKLHVN